MGHSAERRNAKHGGECPECRTGLKLSLVGIPGVRNVWHSGVQHYGPTERSHNIWDVKWSPVNWLPFMELETGFEFN